MTDRDEPKIYRFFTEVGIINQLVSTLVEKHLPDRMTAREFGLLGHLSRRPDGNTPVELARAFQLPKTSMTHSISMLEGRGFIQIAPNPKDARSKIVRMTSKGRDFLAQITRRLSTALGPLIAKIGKDEFTSALPALEKIRIALDAAREN